MSNYYLNSFKLADKYSYVYINHSISELSRDFSYLINYCVTNFNYLDMHILKLKIRLNIPLDLPYYTETPKFWITIIFLSSAILYSLSNIWNACKRLWHRTIQGIKKIYNTWTSSISRKWSTFTECVDNFLIKYVDPLFGPQLTFYSSDLWEDYICPFLRAIWQKFILPIILFIIYYLIFRT